MGRLQKRMRRKRLRKTFFSMLLLSGVVVFTAAYLAMGFYYMDGFSYGTWANGLYCTGKSVEVINEELLDNYRYSEVFVVLYDGEEKVREPIALTPEMVQADFCAPLNQLLAEQNPLLWGENLLVFDDALTVGGRGKNRLLEPQLTVSEELLRKSFLSLAAVRAERARDHALRMEKTAEGYILRDSLAHVLDLEKAYALLREGVEQGRTEVDLTATDAYSDLPEDAQTARTRALWEKVSRFQECGIVYDMGDKVIPVDAGVVCDWIATDEAGDVCLDGTGAVQLREGAIEEFVAGLAAEYDTYGVERPFETTRGERVMVKGVTYGTQLDQKAEATFLEETFLEEKALAEKGLAVQSVVRVPSYTANTYAKVRGRDDIGDTYIEIDISHQTMYYYKEGKLRLETPIVTGNMMRNMGTPSAVCYVYAKQRNRTLRGPGYASFVRYWMPVNGGIGIHDASWRKEYGGDIYKTSGSHGCINTPYDAMVQMFEEVEIGTPVIMFY